jgi:hypothetical protein
MSEQEFQNLKVGDTVCMQDVPEIPFQVIFINRTNGKVSLSNRTDVHYLYLMLCFNKKQVK